MKLIAAIITLFILILPAQAAPMSVSQCAKAFPNLGVSGCKKVRRIYRTPEQTAKRLGKKLLYNGYAYVHAGGGNPWVYRNFVNVMNRQNNTLVFDRRHCGSACAIAWQLARKKCTLHGAPVALSQHKFNGDGVRVNHLSRSNAYWKRVARGKKAPSHEMVRWTDRARKCPDGIQIAGSPTPRGSSRRNAPYNSGPSIFQAPY